MRLWLELARCIAALRPACSRSTTFGWMAMVLFGFCSRRDLAGVTSFVRSSWLASSSYRRLLHLFHSSALKLDRLTACWCTLVLGLFRPLVVNGFLVCVADAIQVAKEGRKMPGVKSLFNDSPDNSKRRFIMGHFFQAISLLADAGAGRVVSIPLLSRITEGVRHSAEPFLSRPSKLAEMFLSLWRDSGRSVLLVVDSYYATRNLIHPLLGHGHGVVSRLRLTAVAYRPAPKKTSRGAGRPKLYGERVPLRELFDVPKLFTPLTLSLYGESITVSYYQVDLLWKPLRRTVRFLLVTHPTQPPSILMTTVLTLSAEQILTLYGHRFKIEHGFKQAKHVLSAYAYHFWFRAMQPIRKASHDQLLDHHSKPYRAKLLAKIDAYHRFVQLGCIAQGLLLHLSVNFSPEVWDSFRSWIRTIRPGVLASEAVVAESLRWSLPAIFDQKHFTDFSFEFLRQRIDTSILPDWFHPAA